MAVVRTVAASPLSDALTRHGEADVAALRPRTGDVAARCTLGAIYARRNDLPRAALYLADCAHADLPDDIAAAVQRTVRDVKRRLDASQLAGLDIVTRTDGLTAEIDALPGETLTTPVTVWVPAGERIIRVRDGDRTWTRRVTAEPHRNGVVMVEPEREARPAAPRTVAIDFAQDDPGAPIEQHTGPPPDIKHPPLTSNKWRGIPDGTAKPLLHDWVPVRPRPTRRPYWLGLRLAGGMFDDSGSPARPGIALGIAGRYRLGSIWFASARVDWSRRGGDAMTGAIDALGAGAGFGATLVGGFPGELALALIGQLRGDLRLADQRNTDPVRRAGLGLAVGVEFALPSSPFTAGVRFEQGVTELVAGARDRALLVELGVDLR
jgi:hypothetical protein